MIRNDFQPKKIINENRYKLSTYFSSIKRNANINKIVNRNINKKKKKKDKNYFKNTVYTFESFKKI